MLFGRVQHGGADSIGHDRVPVGRFFPLARSSRSRRDGRCHPGCAIASIDVQVCTENERRIATATSPSRLTTLRCCCSGLWAMRMGTVMMRFGSNLFRTPALSGLVLVALLVLGAMVVQVFGSTEKGRGVIAASERSEASTRTNPEKDGQVVLDTGVRGLRGSLP